MKKTFCMLLALLLALLPLASAGGIVLPAAADGTPADSPADAYAEGLAVLYSGTQNTRAGQNTDSTVWEDLVGGHDMTIVTDEKNRFTEEGLALDSAKQYFPDEVRDLVNGNAFTVEILLGAFTSIGGDFNTFMNSDNDNFALFRRNSGDLLEFKWAAVPAAQRPTVTDGLYTLQNALVTITYEVGGEVVIYINGTRAAAQNCTAAMGADTLFIGQTGNKAFSTTYRSLRFYSRALTADEVMANAKADGAVQEQETRPVSPGYVTIAQPRTNIAGDVALVRRVDSGTELDTVMSGEVKPAAVIFRINKALEITDKSGTAFLSLDDAMEALAWTVMPVFELTDTDTIAPLAAYLNEIRFFDCFVMSEYADLVQSARAALPSVRGIIDYTETFRGKNGLTREECIDLRKSLKSFDGTIALLPLSAARQETVQYLYDSIVNVWVLASDEPDAVERADALLSGAIGVVSDDTAGLYADAAALPENTMTRVPLNIGHRGVPDSAPENTVEGSLLAYEAGADVIENDVYLTADGQVVVMHDESTGRTCNRNLSVTRSTLAELKELYVNAGFENNENKNTWRIPTLEEYLVAFKGKDCRLFIELKSTQSGLVEAVRDLVNQYDMYDQVAIITFHESQMKDMRELWPEMSVGALCGGYLDETDSDADMRGVMNFIGKYNATLNPSYSGYGENAIRAALLRGIGIYPWTFVGDSYRQHFLWGYSGLTGNTAGVLNRHTKSITLSGAENGAGASVGDSLSLTLTAETYKRTTTDVTYKARFTFLAGEDLVSVENGVMTFAGAGDVTFCVSYTNTRTKQVLTTQPVTIHVTEKVEEATAEPVTETETAAEDSETASAADTTGSGESATGTQTGGCRSSLTGSVLLLPAAVCAALAARRKRKEN